MGQDHDIEAFDRLSDPSVLNIKRFRIPIGREDKTVRSWQPRYQL